MHTKALPYLESGPKLNDNHYSSISVGEKINVGSAITNALIFIAGDGDVISDNKHGKTGRRFQCKSPPAQAKFFEWLHDPFILALDSGAGRPSAADQVEYAR